MDPRRVIPAALLTLALAAPVAGGAAEPPPHDPHIADGTLQRTLDDARRSWKAAGVRSYRYEIREQCFCAPQQGVLVRVRNARPTTYPDRMEDVATVPRLFRVIQRAIDDGVAKLTVSYGRRGVPRSIAIDRAPNAADDEVRYAVTRFTPVKRGSR